MKTKAESLYDILLKPAERLIKKAGILVVSPDGPLHYLPFSALVAGKSRYLAEQKPVVAVISATVLNELESRDKVVSEKIVAFGNPDYAAPPDEDAIRSAAPGKRLAALPATQEEVEKIAGLYGDNAEILTKEKATEEKAKTIGREVAIIHFACHGILDERFPLDSGLALTVPANIGEGRENGILQAWEIFEGLRINADLVTLSACETGLGKEMGGEGLVGLTRAFEYAGAGSVLSSLWSVADESTAILMKNFYRQLREGRSKAEALRLAQNEMIKSGYSHPFYWAGFVLNGEWK